MTQKRRQAVDVDGAPWLRLEFDCGPAQIDAAAELLDRFGVASVSITPLKGAAIEGIAGPAVYGTSNRVSALIAAGTDLDILIACLRNRVGADHIRNVSFEAVADRDWSAEYCATHQPLSFGGKLCICPGWAKPAPGQHVVCLDPGLAFGTGIHATTALCLEWLTGLSLRDLVVIDHGCGSGVLALSAAVLGAREVHAVDIDPGAVDVARENVAKNSLGQRVRVSRCGVDLPAADILVANILLQPLVDLAPTFSVLVKSGGRIALSGILATQTDECAAAYLPWFDIAPPEFRDEWALLPGTRNAAPADRAA
ncbi:MAG: 50S ribosomal protein L11 methyltransferase [Gammaproteobacteria bacterium]|nr:50S ribosomal protein L11 methyltransferase [Gammaproteobacteria bacterium]